MKLINYDYCLKSILTSITEKMDTLMFLFYPIITLDEAFIVKTGMLLVKEFSSQVLMFDQVLDGRLFYLAMCKQQMYNAELI